MAIKNNRWLLPTNTNNMRMIIAQGLISDPAGFKKYYSDALELYPGWIPIFKNQVPLDMIKKGISERESLTPCIMELKINKIYGKITIVKNNTLVDIEIKDLNQENVDTAFILAPLPLSVISRILFISDKDKNKFEDDAQIRHNVVLTGITLRSNSMDTKLFTKQASTAGLLLEDTSNLKLSATNAMEYNKIYSLGGMLATMFYYSKNGKLSNDALSRCIDPDKHNGDTEYSMISNYFYNHDSTINDSDGRQKRYNNLVDAAINRKDFKEAVIEFLELSAPSIAKKLQVFESRSDKPISEEFNEATTMFGKSLLMLFLREDSESLIDYNQVVFSEDDYINFAMLFGIRDKFVKVPKFVREYKELQHFISVLMANYAHTTAGNKINFGKPKKPLTVMDMLKNDRFKEYFAKELKIETCFQTIIPKTDYTVVKGKPIFSGIVMPKFELLEDKYFQSIFKVKLIDYNKYVDKYGKIK